MKKNLFIFITLVLSFIPNFVKADSLNVDLSLIKFVPLNDVSSSFCSNYVNYYYYNDFESFISDSQNKKIFDTLYYDLKNYYNEKFKEEYPYYTISVSLVSDSNKEFNPLTVSLVMKLEHEMNESTPTYSFISSDYYDGMYSVFEGTTPVCLKHHVSVFNYFETFTKGSQSSSYFYTPLSLFETNYDHYFSDYWGDNATINLYKDDVLDSTYVKGDLLPVYFENGYDSVVESKYKTINLNDYAYVLLSLKDYKERDSFNTTLKVKGELCFSAGYEYGTTDKPNGVTDYCTQKYDDFTDVSVTILKNDIKNHAIYYLSGYNSDVENLVKVDTSIFDITPISQEDADNPSIDVDGHTYHPIAYDNMASNAKKNTENGYVPGASCRVGDLNCQVNTPHSSSSSLSDIVKNVTDTLDSIWSTVVYFFSFVTKIFNILPVEIRTISITFFISGCVLGLIKIIKS